MSGNEKHSTQSTNKNPRKVSPNLPADFDPLTSKKLLAIELGGVDLSTLWRWEQEQILPPSIKIGGRVGWPRSVIRKWKLEQGWPVESVNGDPDADSESSAA